MENFDKPEGQTTSDNFLTSEINQDLGRSQSNWGELSAEDKGYLGKKGFKTPAELLKSYRELEKGFSSRVALPKDGDKKALDKLYSRLGMPEDSSGFEISFAKEDEAIGEAFKQACLLNNILPQSAKGIYDWFVKNRSEMMIQRDEEWAENSAREMEDMKREWGAKADRNIALMKRGVRLFTENDDGAVLDIEQALGTKRTMEIFCRLGEAIAEDNPVSFGAGVNDPDEWNAVEYYRKMFNEY